MTQNNIVGRKDDNGKLRWYLLRRYLTPALESVLRVLSFGADKYGDGNWQHVQNAQTRYRDALDRHLAEIDKGITHDPDTGEHHLAHVATNALFLLELAERNTLKKTPWSGGTCPGMSSPALPPQTPSPIADQQAQAQREYREVPQGWKHPGGCAL
jgi:hypothetical protein